MAYEIPSTHRIDHFEPVLAVPVTHAGVDEERRRFCIIQAVALKDEGADVVALATSIYE